MAGRRSAHRKGGANLVLRDYELMYIVRPDLDDEALRAANDSVADLIRGLGGEVGKTSNWGKRRLAYEIQRMRDGHYVVIQIRLEGSRVSELERALQIHDTVFRHLVVVKETAGPAANGEEPGGEGEEVPPPEEAFAGEGSPEDEESDEEEIADVPGAEPDEEDEE
jgi:small subunit ribosomal protein S6